VNRVDYWIVALTALLLAVAVKQPADARFTAVVAVLALGAASVAANHTIPRPSKLVVSYRNPAAGGAAAMWPSGKHLTLLVVVRNVGRGIAEGVEVRSVASLQRTSSTRRATSLPRSTRRSNRHASPRPTVCFTPVRSG
jgi:hypothetical protein